jgi:hypothetical protein
MSFYQTIDGVIQHVGLTADMYKAAHDAKQSVPQYLNRIHADADPKIGTAFAQLCASEGLVAAPKASDNPFGIVGASVADILNNKSGFSAASGTNTEQRGTPFGTASRTLFPAALIAYIESQVAVDRVTDTVLFDDMVCQELSIAGDVFEQPVISYSGTGGPQSAKHQRVAQLADVPTVLQITTTDKFRRLPTYGMGIEMSQQAMKASTIDTLAFTINRYLQVEKDQRVYNYLSSLFAGDNDMVTGAVSAVTSNSLDSAATGGVLTHKAWMSFLARNRKQRRITHVIGDLNAYLAIESRTGRPGLSAYDNRLSTIDSQAALKNSDFAQDVKFFLVDFATAGGPVPANTVWALDATQAISRVKNTEAEYTAIEQFISRRSELMVLNWSEEVFRFFGDSALQPFDVLTIS